MWRILYPLRYFRLKAEGKAYLDLVPTIILASLIATPYLIFGGVFFGQDGLLHNLVNVTAALGGFYVAALVAAASFSNADLDKVIRSGPIALVSKDANGQQITDFLTRREFACMMFGYLAFATILYSILAAVAVGLGRETTAPDWILSLANHPYRSYFSFVHLSHLRAAVIVAFALGISHIASVTALGLYYLMDRLYRYDRTITTPKGGGRVDEAA